MRRAAILLSLLFLPAALAAQGRETCNVEIRGVTRGGVLVTSTNIVTMPDGTKNTYWSGGVDATCIGQGNRLLADSAEHYQDRGLLILINRVRYSEARMNMQSDRMVYYTREERLLATGNVRGKTNTGARFTGPEMEYMRAKPGLRATPSWRAPGRPFVRMPPQDTVAKRPRTAGETAVPDSVDLTADIITSQNDSLIWLDGNVIIERQDMRATGDSATLDQGTGYAKLMQKPSIVGRGERPFTMTGVELDMWSKEQHLERVRSSGEARVVSDSLTMNGDTIDLRFSEQRMQQVYTWGERATAITPQQEIEADSLDIRMPGQQLREFHALGKAIAHTTVDTARLTSTERDWIAGDTIVAFFDSAAAGDTASGTKMRQVTASGSARAFYQIAPSSGEKGEPSLSYNRGREIIVSFKDGEVANVDVKDRASGLYLEPIAPPSDTSKTPSTKPVSKRP